VTTHDSTRLAVIASPQRRTECGLER
jgi:hypothetical protein